MSPTINPSGGGGVAGGAITQIADSLLAAPAANFDFTGIAGTFTSLIAIVYGRGDTAAVSTTVLLRFNGDAGANYDTELDTVSNAVAGGGEIIAGTSMQIWDIPASTAPASVFGHGTILIPNYAGTVGHKGASQIGGHKTTNVAAGAFFRAYAGFWRSTAAINRVTLTPTAGNFIAGSRATLYGLT